MQPSPIILNSWLLPAKSPTENEELMKNKFDNPETL